MNSKLFLFDAIKGQNILCFEMQDNEWYRGQIMNKREDQNSGEILYLIHFYGWDEQWDSWVTRDLLSHDHLVQSYSETKGDPVTHLLGIDVPKRYECFVEGETSRPGEQSQFINQAVLHISIHGGDAHIKIFDTPTEEQNMEIPSGDSKRPSGKNSEHGNENEEQGKDLVKCSIRGIGFVKCTFLLF